MPLRSERVRAVLPRVNPARLRSGWPVGVRDGALLALLASGFTAREISGLHATSITMDRGHILVTIYRQDVLWRAMLPIDLGARLLTWLTERRLWAEPKPVFTGRQGRLSPMAIHQVLHRYRRQRRSRRC